MAELFLLQRQEDGVYVRVGLLIEFGEVPSRLGTTF